jgi:hypothetical protein
LSFGTGVGALVEIQAKLFPPIKGSEMNFFSGFNSCWRKQALKRCKWSWYKYLFIEADLKRNILKVIFA